MCKKKWEHYVLIRFNIRIAYTGIIKNEKQTKDYILDEKYLKERFRLFSLYTLPSLKKQSCQNFKILVLFHKNTPYRFVQMIKKLQKEYFFEALFLGDDEEFSFEQYIKNNMEEKYEFYLTSRIDNDDMYTETYIQDIQNFVSSQNLKKCFLSFPRGEKFDLHEQKRYEFDYTNNHFITMYAPCEWSVFGYSHGNIDGSGLDIITLKPNTVMWTEIVHDLNVHNEVQLHVKNQHLLLKLKRMNEKRKIMNQEQIVIYGVGEMGQAIYRLVKNRHSVIAFVDEYTDMEEYDGIPIKRLMELPMINAHYGILITVTKDNDVIKKEIEKVVNKNIEIKIMHELC